MITRFIAFFAVSLLFVFANAQCPHDASGLTLWSSQAGWNVAGASVTIAAGQRVLFDVASLSLTSITVNGDLIFDNKDIALTVEWIRVNSPGQFIMGSSDDGCQIDAKITLTFVGEETIPPANVLGNDPEGGALGDKGLAITTGSSLYLHGAVSGPMWTRLASTAQSGATTITLQESVDWNVGDHIIIASTDFSEIMDYTVYNQATTDLSSITWMVGRGSPDQSEEKIVSAVSGDGKTVTLDSALLYTHWGAGYERAEVGLLTRNIVIQGEEASINTTFGGHIIMRNATKIEIAGVELYRMGQHGTLGRYPVHFHLQHDKVGAGFFARDNAIHKSYQRCITIHDTNGITLTNNVAYDIIGHCYFLEDGPERKNTLEHNLGITAHPVPTGDPKLIAPTDNEPSIFWITNPDNNINNNAAVGSKFGFWFVMPDFPIGTSQPFYANTTEVRPRLLPLGSFKGNVAHSAAHSGLFIDEMLTATGTSVLAAYNPRVGPYLPSLQFYQLQMIDALFENYIGYKNRFYGAWTRGGPLIFRNFTLLDNRRCFNAVPGPSLFEDSLCVAETDNVGRNRTATEGRHQPDQWINPAPIIGIETYDNGGPQYIRNVVCRDFVTNDFRPAGCISTLDNGPFVHQTRNKYYGLTFDNANEVYINNSTADGPHGGALLDVDGTVTGHKLGGWIVSDWPKGDSWFVEPSTDACELRPEWNAWFCPIFPEGYVALTMTVDNVNLLGDSYLYDNPGTNIIRGSFFQLGSGKEWPANGKPTGTIDFQFVTNVSPRKAYTIRLLNGTATPPSLTFRIPSSARGDWLLFALPYPANAGPFNVNYSRYGSSPTPLTQAPSLENIRGPHTTMGYFWDNTTNYLWLYLENIAENTDYTDRWGFVDYSWDGGELDVVAVGCAGLPANCIPATQFDDPLPTPPALVNSKEGLLQADIAKCGSTAAGTGYFFLDPTSGALHASIYHDQTGDVDNVYLRDTAQSNRVLNDFLGSGGSPVRASFLISLNTWEHLLKGNMEVVIEHGNGQSISGKLGCTDVNDCPLPKAVTGIVPCANQDNSVVIFTDGPLPSYPRWQFWGYNNDNDPITTVFDDTSTEDVLCGTNAIKLTVQNGAMMFGYSANPAGNVSQFSVNLTSHPNLEFWVKVATPGRAALLEVALDNYNQSWNSRVTVQPRHINNFLIEDIAWSRVRIPLAEFHPKEPAVQDIRTFVLRQQGYSNSAIDLFIDNIIFTPDVTETPQNTLSKSDIKTYSVSPCNPGTSLDGVGGDGGDGGDGDGDGSGAQRLRSVLLL